MKTGENITLEKLGWNSFFEEAFRTFDENGLIPARVVMASKNSTQLYTPNGEITARIAGRMRHLAEREFQKPVAGDWVAVKPDKDEKGAIIQAILPRKSKFSRKAPGEQIKEQIISANIDTVFIVSSLDGGRGHSLRRIERYLTLAWNSGSSPVIVLNKADLCPDVDSIIRQVEEIAPGVPIHPVSGKDKTGMDFLKTYFYEGQTVALLGPSGVGKSTIINALLGFDRQATGCVREYDLTGRHTTTSRELIMMPGGGMVIDTPGMRELQLWADEENLQASFNDIEELAEKCRFNNCSHNTKPGCAIINAINQGELDPQRLESYRKLQSEIAYISSAKASSARQYEKQKWKNVAKLVKEIKKRDKYS
jgi:ribosome biogenesis GTPase